MQFRNLFTTILLGISGIGRRHDWEGAVVSLDLRTNHINDGVTASAYGHWRKYPNPDGANVDGTHVKLQYSAEPWDRLGGPAQQAINNPSHWGDSTNASIAESHRQATPFYLDSTNNR
ncbi:necrosis inducing-like protein npp1 type [Moniliophthora roreri]|nr:necrosis inducing-like protein npp1 type [Moniliophthora roreri]